MMPTLPATPTAPLLLTCPACHTEAGPHLNWIPDAAGRLRLGAWCGTCGGWIRCVRERGMWLRCAPPVPPGYQMEAAIKRGESLSNQIERQLRRNKARKEGRR